MGVLSGFFKSSFEKWVKHASHEDLSAAYEKERLQWLKDGAGNKTEKMCRLNAEIRKRVEEEWENDPSRNRDSNFHWTDANRWDKD